MGMQTGSRSSTLERHECLVSLARKTTEVKSQFTTHLPHVDVVPMHFIIYNSKLMSKLLDIDCASGDSHSLVTLWWRG